MTDIVSNIIEADLSRRTEQGEWAAGRLVGRPFKLEYATARIATPDAWKQRAGGIPQGCFLLAFYDHDEADAGAAEAVLLRVLGPTPLPSDNDSLQAWWNTTRTTYGPARRPDPSSTRLLAMSSLSVVWMLHPWIILPRSERCPLLWR